MISIEEIKENIKCPQFGDVDYGKWGSLRVEQRIAYRDLINIVEEQDKVIKTITKQVSENEDTAIKLLKENVELKEELNKANEEIKDLQEQVEYQNLWRNEYLNRIDKSIEYIKEYFYIDEDTGEYYLTHTFDGSNLYELLEILDKENK